MRILIKIRGNYFLRGSRKAQVDGESTKQVLASPRAEAAIGRGLKKKANSLIKKRPQRLPISING